MLAEVERQVAELPREKIARAALSEARAVLVRSPGEAAEVANAYAPEHLSLQVEIPSSVLPLIEAAGTVFVGRFAAETFGDYVCGPSHVLPTDGAARTWSGVSTASFMTSFVVQEIGRDAAQHLAPAAARLARLEGLEAHARAAGHPGRLRCSAPPSPRSSLAATACRTRPPVPRRCASAWPRSTARRPSACCRCGA